MDIKRQGREMWRAEQSLNVPYYLQTLGDKDDPNRPFGFTAQAMSKHKWVTGVLLLFEIAIQNLITLPPKNLSVKS